MIKYNKRYYKLFLTYLSLSITLDLEKKIYRENLTLTILKQSPNFVLGKVFKSFLNPLSLNECLLRVLKPSNAFFSS